MIYRAFASVIVIFWLVMTGLLIRNELVPEASALRELPLDHVLKHVFHHEQPSDLRIFSGNLPIGHLRVHPQNQTKTSERTLDFTGTVELSLGQQKNRVSWNGTLVLGTDYSLRSSEWGVTLHDPGYLRADFKTEANSPTMQMTLSSKEGASETQHISMNEEGLNTVAQQFGASPDMLAMVKQARAQAELSAKPRLRARQAHIYYRGERTETYLVTIEQNQQILLECHISQLGQILRAKNIFGHTLHPEDIVPS